MPASVYADFVMLQRAGWWVQARTFAGPVLLVLGCGIIGCAPLYGWGEWCTPASAILALAGSYVLTRGRLSKLLLRSCFGWCGALPVSRQTTTWTLLGLTIIALAGAALVGAVFLALAALLAPHPEDLGMAVLAMDGGLAVGTLAAILRTVGRGASSRSLHADVIREPLFTLSWLDVRGLPHLLDWQRRSALVKWRRGGSLVLIAPVLAMGPGGASILKIVGLGLWIGSVVWLAVVMQECAGVTRNAAQLLDATPVVGRRMRVASLRYPLVASICALALVVVGSLLMGHGVLAVLIWLGCAIAISLWPFVCITRATSSEHLA